jgi:aryl-alcohol dehydrogenase-like predicted oxidoreductase
MQFTKFGQTGLTVSRMILGTGTFGKQTDEKEAHRMLDKAAEAGINFIDTADVYPLARTSVVLKSSQAAGSAISGQGLSSPQRAAEKWGQPLGMQAARENTYLTPSTLPCAA